MYVLLKLDTRWLKLCCWATSGSSCPCPEYRLFTAVLFGLVNVRFWYPVWCDGEEIVFIPLAGDMYVCPMCCDCRYAGEWYIEYLPGESPYVELIALYGEERE